MRGFIVSDNQTHLPIDVAHNREVYCDRGAILLPVPLSTPASAHGNSYDYYMRYANMYRIICDLCSYVQRSDFGRLFYPVDFHSECKRSPATIMHVSFHNACDADPFSGTTPALVSGFPLARYKSLVPTCSDGFAPHTS
jgi:hypothetical protein